MDSSALFAGLATASAAIYGIPAGFYASRLISLSERAASLQREHGDLLNQQGIHGPDRESDWAARLRRDALADLFELATSVRRSSTLLTSGAMVLVSASLFPLALVRIERGWYAAFVFAGFVALGLWWVRDFRLGADGLIRTTRVQFELRKRKQEAATNEGQPYLMSGDPAALRDPALADRFTQANPEVLATRKGRRMIRRWKRSIRRRREAHF